MPNDVRAATLRGPGELEVEVYPRPVLGGSVAALLRVEMCGICGTDVELLAGHFTATTWPAGPLIPGHEVVGTIEEIDGDAASRWGVAVGDRVAIEPNLPCGSCTFCLQGSYTSCRGWPQFPMAYGFVPTSHPPSLWGGWSEVMVLHPQTVVHRVPDGLDAGTASMFNALGAGFKWAVSLPRLSRGQTVLVLGPGQRGLACVAAAKAAGAGVVLVTGRSGDAHRLAAAIDLGADVVIDVDREDVIETIREVTDGGMADVAVDASAGATAPVVEAVGAVRPEGTVVLAGLKGGRRVDGLPVDDVVLRGITIIGARSADRESYAQALQLLAESPDRFARLRTHEFPIGEAMRAVRTLAGEEPGEQPIYVSVYPD
jgi:threonine dehydrogenase-like Zn-dependent dehydrogenase